MNRLLVQGLPFLISPALQSTVGHQLRGITVRVLNGNVDQAVQLLGRKMRESGMESAIKKKAYFGRFMCDRHIKDSTRRYAFRRDVQYRIRNQKLFQTLRTLLAKKISGH